MRFLMLLFPGPGFDRPFDPVEDLAGDQELGQFIERLSEAGKFLLADGLHPSSEGGIVSFRNSGHHPVITEGPFPEASDVLSGYWIIQADSVAEALDWASQIPAGDNGRIEVRRIFDTKDGPQELPFDRSVETAHA